MPHSFSFTVGTRCVSKFVRAVWHKDAVNQTEALILRNREYHQSPADPTPKKFLHRWAGRGRVAAKYDPSPPVAVSVCPFPCLKKSAGQVLQSTLTDMHGELEITFSELQQCVVTSTECRATTESPGLPTKPSRRAVPAVYYVAKPKPRVLRSKKVWRRIHYVQPVLGRNKHESTRTWKSRGQLVLGSPLRVHRPVPTGC